MPTRSMKPCAHPGCFKLVRNERYCEKHERQRKREVDEHRENSYRRGYNKRWSRYRQEYLQAHPLCVECERHGITTAATVVDHIVPHRGDNALFWDPDNHQALCERCHNIKTAKHDGAFGNPTG